jgi:hypothetical protein
MRIYLTNNFLPGLINAGVPEDVLWEPSRRVANKGGSGADAANIITDKLWLPTEREMFGARTYSNATYETSANQASFTGFYANAGARIKYNASNEEGWLPGTYWLASPYTLSNGIFCYVNTSGAVYGGGALTVRGIAPAFCVR